MACWSFSNLSLMEFQVRYLALFLFFSVIDSFEWFLIGSLHKNTHSMLEFLKAPFLVLHFSYYTLMTLLMLSVILLSMLMILLSYQCGNDLNWLLNMACNGVLTPLPSKSSPPKLVLPPPVLKLFTPPPPVLKLFTPPSDWEWLLLHF